MRRWLIAFAFCVEAFGQVISQTVVSAQVTKLDLAPERSRIDVTMTNTGQRTITAFAFQAFAMRDGVKISCGERGHRRLRSDAGNAHLSPRCAPLGGTGFDLCDVDASESQVKEFRNRFPAAAVECNSVEDSRFFDRQFDAVVAWGLIFLLSADGQRKLIAKVARVLKPGGHFLFTCQPGVCAWSDEMTGLESLSLGREGYEMAL